MPRLTTIYTRKGDEGETSLGGGQRVPKDSARVAAYGTVDELNSAIGVALAHGLSPRLRETLPAIQNELFHLGSDLAFREEDKQAYQLPQIEDRHIQALEELIDELNEVVGPLTNFILPGGSPGAAQLHVARTIQQQGYKPAMFCTCGSMVTTVAAWPKLGTAAEGAFGTTPSWPSQKFAGLDDLAAYFKEQGQSTVPTYAIVALSILQVIEQAVEGAKTLDQAKLKEYIHSHEFHTAAGNIKYQADGTPVYSQIILQFQNGKNEVVWPEKYRTAAPVIPAVR